MRVRQALGVLAALAAWACADKKPSEKVSNLTASSTAPAAADSAPGAQSAGSAPSASAAPAPEDHLYVNPARRCSECHGRIHEQWSTSAHSRAASSPAYRTMRTLAKDPGCDGCHAPLDGHIKPSHPATGEGVNCDACHTVREVTVGARASTVARGLDDNTRYGTLSDATNHYFHRMGYSAMYGDARYCAGCHHGAHALSTSAVAGESPVPFFSEYDEWRAGPFAKKDVPCQRCHMPGAEAEVATGAGVRQSVPHHGWLGVDGDLRKRALRAKAVVQQRAEEVRVEVSVENVRAGHPVPTGLPERRIVVDAQTLDKAGSVTATATAAYGRHLVDAQGKPAPFFAARREALDNRLRPKEPRLEHFTLAAPREGTVVVRLTWQSLDPEIAVATGIRTPPSEVLGEARLELGPATVGQTRHVELSR